MNKEFNTNANGVPYATNSEGYSINPPSQPPEHNSKIQEMAHLVLLLKENLFEQQRIFTSMAMKAIKPSKIKPPQTEEDKENLVSKVMEPFTGWMNYQVIEYLEWLIKWNKKKVERPELSIGDDYE